MEAYSQDLRERVLADSDSGMGAKEVASNYRVSVAWVNRLKQRRRETGDIRPKKKGGYREELLKPHKARIEQLLREKPDILLREIRDELNIELDLSNISRTLRRWGYLFKKNSSSFRTGPS